MSSLDKQFEHLAYSRDNLELTEELEAIKAATGAKRVELSRALFRRFCEFQSDLSDQGDFCGQLGLSSELTEFIFTGLRSWADGGSLEATVLVDAKPGRPPQTQRNHALFEDVRRRVTAGWDVHAACYATADALLLGDVAGLEARVLSPSSIRRIYYSVMSAVGEKESFSPPVIDNGAVEDKVLHLVDEKTVSRANDGQWSATLEIFRRLQSACEQFLTRRYLTMIARLIGLNLDVLEHQNACLKKMIDGQSPNEVYGYDSKK